MMVQTAWELLLQVTVWSIVGVCLLAVTNLWWPERLMSLAWRFLIGIVVLTLLVWLPWPRWLTSFNSSTVHSQAAELASEATLTALPSHGVGFSDAWQVWQKWIPAVPTVRATDSMGVDTISWTLLAYAIIVAGICLGIWRFLNSYRFVREQVNSSQVIHDHQLLEQCTGLARQLGIPNHVPLRESPALHVPATVGYWKPVILLPANWSTWSEAECQTVLAHELAHIHRFDYLTMVLTQLIVIVYWFHPLVGWLSRYLRTGQELAADALAVRVLGDRTSYLQCLARLALVQDGARLPAPARLFLSPEVSLLRRIAMLRKGSHGIAGSGRLVRWGLVGMLAFGVLVASLRSSVQADDPLSSTNPTVNQDWRRYVDAENPGFVVFHPAACLSLPSMQQHRAFLNLMCKDEFDGLYAKLGLGVPLDAIECVFCNLLITPRKNSEVGTGSMTFSGNYLRFRTAQDTDTWLRHCAKSVETITNETGTYYKTHSEPGYSMDGVCFIRPDERTLVFARDSRELKRWLSNAGKPVTKPDWLPVWPSDKDMLTAAFNVQHHLVVQAMKEAGTDMPLYPVIKPILTGTDCMQLTASQADQPVITVTMLCKSEEKAASQLKQVDALLALLKVLQVSGTTGSTPQKEVTEHQQLVKIVNDTKTKQHDRGVVLTLTSPAPLGSLVDAPLGEMKHRYESIKASEGKK